ncbi:hypothetical protein K2173_025048 [Erythroxylum novogranatense]|uniref:J domain-containing protein n=1 Tax=Erythroxylum novogranatense TaxID=1862640 RepID=A0AAV8SVB4_9ROSI|nr:hypothetical protein K2173_025048 [Erythroxylum novogranatense]
MSPPAVDSRYHATSETPSVNTTIPNFSQSFRQQHNVKSDKVFGNPSEFFQAQNACPPRTRPANRSRPRLAKLRKQSRGRSNEGFNTSQSACENYLDFARVSKGFLEECVSSEVEFSNLDFGFSADGGMNTAVNLNSSEKFAVQIGQFGSTVESSKSDNDGFVFTRKQGQFSTDDISHDKLDDVGSFANRSDLTNVNSGTKLEFADDTGVGFESGIDRSSFMLNLNPIMGCSSCNMAKRESATVEFVFGANQNVSTTNGKVTGSGFVFGASGSKSVSNSNEDKINFDKSPKSLSDDAGEIERNTNEVKITSVKYSNNGNENNPMFVFGSSDMKTFNFSECWGDVKSCTESCENYNSISKDQDGNFRHKFNFSSFEATTDMPGAFTLNPICDLGDGMSKLNIHGDIVREPVDFGSIESNKSCNTASASVGISNSESFTSHAVLNGSFIDSQLPQLQVNDVTAAASFMPSTKIGFESHIGISEAPTMGVVVNEIHEKSSLNSPDRLELPLRDFKAPQWDFSCLKESLFPELTRKQGMNVKGSSKRGKMLRRQKVKQYFVNKEQSKIDPAQDEDGTEESEKYTECYSPMDFSPYEETTSAEELPMQASACSTQLDNNNGHSVYSPMVVPGLQDQKTDINENKDKSNIVKNESHNCLSDRSVVIDHSSSVFGAGTAFLDFNSKQVCNNDGDCAASTEDKKDFNPECSDGLRFSFASGLEGIDGRKFSFSASSSERSNLSSSRRLPKKKTRRKVPNEPFVIMPELNAKVQGEEASTSQKKVGNTFETNEQTRKGFPSGAVAFLEDCETWRLRGNQAYKEGDLLKAEELYTHGINVVPPTNTLGCCLRPLVICYSNRAATRMSLGNIREALADCMMATALDPNFLKVQIRAANCHLVLGEIEKAMHYFNICLDCGAGVCLDRRLTVEAATGLQRAQKVAGSLDRCVEFLEQKTSDAALNGLDIIAEALSISPYSEKLLEMKAEFMFMLQRYEEVIQICEETLCAAEKNFLSVGVDNPLGNTGDSENKSFSFAKLWRWSLTSKSQFCLGRLEAALVLLDKLKQMGSINDKYASKLLESTSLHATICDLLSHKNAGNEAVCSGRYAEALDHYSTALASNVESRPFAAICFCNRAAAYQALDQITDAIADCSLAIALDGNYCKAISRRATLHEMIRDYGHAASDLQRLISILESQSQEKSSQFGRHGRSASTRKELRQAQHRLSLMEEEAKNGIPLDLYLILGIKKSDAANDVKKAYRKAALRHHPDKAGQSLARSQSGYEGRLWKEIVHEVHADAHRLFKMIGEAYAILSDPTKRSEYDFDEETRNKTKESNGSRRNGRWT